MSKSMFPKQKGFIKFSRLQDSTFFLLFLFHKKKDISVFGISCQKLLSAKQEVSNTEFRNQKILLISRPF